MKTANFESGLPTVGRVDRKRLPQFPIRITPDLGLNLENQPFSNVATREAQEIGTRFLETVRAGHVLGDFSRACTCSIGVTLFQGTGSSPGKVIQRVDIAMYRAGAANRSNMTVFELDQPPVAPA